MNLGQALKKIRIAKDLSQKEVALSCKMDTAQYSRIENSKTDPSFSAVVRICKALGVDLSDLFRTDEVFKEVNSKNRSLMEKLSMVDTLGKDEQQAIFKVIDLAVSNKKMKDNLTQLIAQ
ncbi:MAG: helix-turn-helix transcriptional regulator [Ginsengibacter sp.]